MSRGRHARRRRFELSSLWRRTGGRRRRRDSPGAQAVAPNLEVVALRQRLEAMEAYANQVTSELNLLRAQLADFAARPAQVATAAAQPGGRAESVDLPQSDGLWPVADLLPPVDLTPPAEIPQGVDLPEYAAVYRQIQLPETPPIWAGPPVTWASPDEQPVAQAAFADQPAAAEDQAGEWSVLSLDIPLVTAAESQIGTDAGDPMAAGAVGPAPLIDMVPTVTRRAS